MRLSFNPRLARMRPPHASARRPQIARSLQGESAVFLSLLTAGLERAQGRLTARGAAADNSPFQMSVSVRVFFVDGVRITRIPTRQFERLWRGDHDATMPDHAGRQARCAMAYVEVLDRQPVGILQIDYMVLAFGSDGRLDPSARRRQEMLALESVSRNLPRVSESVVEIGPHLAGRQYREEFKWTPTDELARTIHDLALR